MISKPGIEQDSSHVDNALIRHEAGWLRPEDLGAVSDDEPRSKYHREIKPGVWVDVYDVLSAWAVENPALQHLIKKALAPGQRGHKDLMTDLDDIIVSAKRAKELEQ
ncbi:hypothetical protein MRB56_09190 [Halomonas cupida]|uniref:hypothetical protein n=1 Tax=Halomonas cupida TaxID=44933 RepID=UPI0039B636D4